MGRCMIMAACGRDASSKVKWFSVREIKLSDDLLAEAKTEPVIKNFVKGSKLVLHSKTKPSQVDQVALKQAMARGDITTAMNLGSYSAQQALPTKEEGIAIRNWISNTSGAGDAIYKFLSNS